MSLFFSFWLTLLRVAIWTTDVAQGILMNLHDFVERLEMQRNMPNDTTPVLENSVSTLEEEEQTSQSTSVSNDSEVPPPIEIYLTSNEKDSTFSLDTQQSPSKPSEDCFNECEKNHDSNSCQVRGNIFQNETGTKNSCLKVLNEKSSQTDSNIINASNKNNSNDENYYVHEPCMYASSLSCLSSELEVSMLSTFQENTKETQTYSVHPKNVYPQTIDHITPNELKPNNGQKQASEIQAPMTLSTDMDGDKSEIVPSEQEALPNPEVNIIPTLARTTASAPHFMHSSNDKIVMVSEVTIDEFVQISDSFELNATLLNPREQDASVDVKIHLAVDPCPKRKDSVVERLELCETAIQPTRDITPASSDNFPTPESTDSETSENATYIQHSYELMSKQSDSISKNSSNEMSSSTGLSSVIDEKESAKPMKTDESIKVSTITENNETSLEEQKHPVRFQVSEAKNRKDRGKSELKPRCKPRSELSSEEECDAKHSKKRLASPAKVYKSPKKISDIASKSKGFTFSPEKTFRGNKQKPTTIDELSSYVRHDLDLSFGVKQKLEVSIETPSLIEKLCCLNTNEGNIPDVLNTGTENVLESFNESIGDNMESTSSKFSEIPLVNKVDLMESSNSESAEPVSTSSSYEDIYSNLEQCSSDLSNSNGYHYVTDSISSIPNLVISKSSSILSCLRTDLENISSGESVSPRHIIYEHPEEGMNLKEIAPVTDSPLTNLSMQDMSNQDPKESESFSGDHQSENSIELDKSESTNKLIDSHASCCDTFPLEMHEQHKYATKSMNVESGDVIGQSSAANQTSMNGLCYENVEDVFSYKDDSIFYPVCDNYKYSLGNSDIAANMHSILNESVNLESTTFPIRQSNLNSDIQASSSNSNDAANITRLQCYFSPVLEELMQKAGSRTRSLDTISMPSVCEHSIEEVPVDIIQQENLPSSNVVDCQLQGNKHDLQSDTVSLSSSSNSSICLRTVDNTSNSTMLPSNPCNAVSKRSLRNCFSLVLKELVQKTSSDILRKSISGIDEGKCDVSDAILTPKNVIVSDADFQLQDVNKYSPKNPTATEVIPFVENEAQIVPNTSKIIEETKTAYLSEVFSIELIDNSILSLLPESEKTNDDSSTRRNAVIEDPCNNDSKISASYEAGNNLGNEIQSQTKTNDFDTLEEPECLVYHENEDCANKDGSAAISNEMSKMTNTTVKCITVSNNCTSGKKTNNSESLYEKSSACEELKSDKSTSTNIDSSTKQADKTPESVEACDTSPCKTKVLEVRKANQCLENVACLDYGASLTTAEARTIPLPKPCLFEPLDAEMGKCDLTENLPEKSEVIENQKLLFCSKTSVFTEDSETTMSFSKCLVVEQSKTDPFDHKKESVAFPSLTDEDSLDSRLNMALFSTINTPDALMKIETTRNDFQESEDSFKLVCIEPIGSEASVFTEDSDTAMSLSGLVDEQSKTNSLDNKESVYSISSWTDEDSLDSSLISQDVSEENKEPTKGNKPWKQKTHKSKKKRKH